MILFYDINLFLVSLLGSVRVQENKLLELIGLNILKSKTFHLY